MRRAIATGVLAVVLAACGGGSDDSAETPVDAAPDATVSTVAPTTVAPTPAGDADATAGEPEVEASSGEAPATTSTPATTAAPIEVPEKLQHVGDAVGGGMLDLSVYAGRDTIAWFWAPW